jgi:cytoskeletal protein RodZ
MTSIGQILANARRKRKITVKDVEKAIKIRAKYITALEQDDFDQIPGEAYAVGFIKTYAQWLEVDETVLLECYREQVGPERNNPAIGESKSDARSWYRNRVFVGGVGVILFLAATGIIMMVLSTNVGR